MAIKYTLNPITGKMDAVGVSEDDTLQFFVTDAEEIAALQEPENWENNEYIGTTVISAVYYVDPTYFYQNTGSSFIRIRRETDVNELEMYVTSAAEISLLLEEENWADDEYVGVDEINSGVIYIDQSYYYHKVNGNFIRIKHITDDTITRSTGNSKALITTSESDMLKLDNETSKASGFTIPALTKIIGASVEVTQQFTSEVNINYENPENNDVYQEIAVIPHTAEVGYSIDVFFYKDEENPIAAEDLKVVASAPGQITGEIKVIVFYQKFDTV